MGVVIIDKVNKCLCDCGTKCIQGRSGMAERCTKEEIEGLGYKAKTLEELLSTPHYMLGETEKKMEALKKTYKRYK